MLTPGAEQVGERKQKVVEKYGEWTAHNIHLGGGLYTIGNFVRGDEHVARRVLQMAADVIDRPFGGVRVLDLACLEGLYAIEFALHGAQALGIEIREANIEKARFAKELLALSNLEFVQDDVRNLSRSKYGLFDVVLCLGILYHLNAPDVFEFVYQMAEVCQRCLIIDTHISTTGEASLVHRGEEYWGRFFREHEPAATPEEKKGKLWASIDNAESFWLTRPSLYNLLARAGFTSVYECHSPPVMRGGADRVTLLAIKGQEREIISSPLAAAARLEGWHEQEQNTGDPAAAAPPSILRRAVRALPPPVKKVVKKFVR